MNAPATSMSDLRERAPRHIPCGVNSDVRPDAPNTFFTTRGAGPRIHDVDDRDYIDYPDAIWAA